MKDKGSGQGKNMTTESLPSSPIVIRSLEYHLKDLYWFPLTIQAPAIEDAMRNEEDSSLVAEFTKELENIDPIEVDKFLDFLTDLFSNRYSVDELPKLQEKVLSYGQIGKIISILTEYLKKLETEEELKKFLKLSISANAKRITKLHDLLGEEAQLAENEERFTYLLVSQAIFKKVTESLKVASMAIDSITIENEESAKPATLFTWLGLFGVIRVEAFRRQKIDLSGLYETHTALVTMIPETEELLFARPFS
jgi:hypothetical protein